MISFVYLDLGGVVELDFSGTNKWTEMKQDMGINEKNADKFDTVWEQYSNRLCLDCDVDTLIPLLKKECGIQLADDYSMLADFVNRFEPNPSIWPVIENIRQTRHIGILTNMYPRMLGLIRKSNIIPLIKWDVIIDSSVVGLQKPDVEIFELAERLAKVKKDEILFVDNTPEHIKAAKAFGWQTFLYDPTHPQESSNKLAGLT